MEGFETPKILYVYGFPLINNLYLRAYPFCCGIKYARSPYSKKYFMHIFKKIQGLAFASSMVLKMHIYNYNVYNSFLFRKIVLDIIANLD